MKKFFKYLGFLGLLVLFFFIGLFSGYRINIVSVANVAGASYLHGCVTAKTEIFGKSDGAYYDKCFKQASDIYMEILGLSVFEMDLKPTI